MKKSGLYAFTLLASLLILSGCAATQENKDKSPALDLLRPENISDTRQAAGTFTDALWNSLKQNDFKIFKAAIPPTFTRKITPEMFNSMRANLMKQFGDFDSSSYLGMLDQGLVCDHLWVFRFKRTSPDGKVSTPREIICWVRVYQEKNTHPAVGGFGFKPF